HHWHRDQQPQHGALANILEKRAQLLAPAPKPRRPVPGNESRPLARISTERPIATDWKYVTVMSGWCEPRVSRRSHARLEAFRSAIRFCLALRPREFRLHLLDQRAILL